MLCVVRCLVIVVCCYLFVAKVCCLFVVLCMCFVVWYTLLLFVVCCFLLVLLMVGWCSLCEVRCGLFVD